jgi:hypothetical protein
MGTYWTAMYDLRTGAVQVANQKFADVVLEHYQANDIM